MFRKKRLYKIVYKLLVTYTTIIEAKDEFQALKKFKREVKDAGIRPTIILFEEIQV